MILYVENSYFSTTKLSHLLNSAWKSSTATYYYYILLSWGFWGVFQLKMDSQFLCKGFFFHFGTMNLSILIVFYFILLTPNKCGATYPANHQLNLTMMSTIKWCAIAVAIETLHIQRIANSQAKSQQNIFYELSLLTNSTYHAIITFSTNRLNVCS